MIEVKVIASGSHGNSVLVTSGTKRILIDCGMDISTMTRGITSVGASWNSVKAILVTHEHGDHIRSAVNLQENYAIPVFTNINTMTVLKRKTELKGGYYFEGTSPFTLCGMEIRPFRVSHDSIYPVGYSIADGDSRFVYATDLGFFSREVAEATRGADLVLIESNHDVDMLLKGPYPPYLKQRILSDHGHLSNVACGKAIAEIMESGTRNFILGHISEHNNTYEVARASVEEYLASVGATHGRDYTMHVATQKGLEEVVCAKRT